MEPINYSIDTPSPFQAFNSGIQTGANIQALQLQNQQRQQAVEQQKALQLDLVEYSKNPSPAAIANLSVKYPQLSEQFKRSYDMLSPEAQKAKIETAAPVYAALVSGNNNFAFDLLTKQSEAYKNSGDVKNAEQFSTFAKLVKDHPETAKTTAGLLLSSVMGADKFATTFQQLEEQSRAAAKAPAELAKLRAEAEIQGIEAKTKPETIRLANANIDSQIKERSKRLDLDADKLLTETQLKVQENTQKYGELPEWVNKEINAASLEAVTSKQSSEKMLQLANKLETEGGGYGAATSAGEWIKKATGNQNEMTRLRAEYNRIVTPSAMAAYKKVAAGSTSDKDIETAMIGVPKDDADAKTLASFLRGAAKIQQYDIVLNTVKADWLAANRGNLNKAKSDIEVDGVMVPAGTTFNEYSEQFLKKKIENLSKQQTQSNPTKKGYMKYATGTNNG